jgi:hypothetical protein
MLTWWVNRSSSAPVSRSVPKVSVHSSNGRLLVIVSGGYAPLISHFRGVAMG